MTREQLKEHCKKQIENCEIWATYKGKEPHGEVYEEHKLILELLEQEPRWIPVSEKLPNDRDWYLGIFKEPDTGWINPIPFICDYVGKETKATTKEFWILRGFTDRDVRDCDYYFNLECVAWMPWPSRASIDALIMREVKK